MSDANTQDMAVEDKEHPALAATEEAQNVATLNRVVVPPPAYTDPNNPAAAGGSINLDLDEHPSVISEDYGDTVSPGAHSVTQVADTHSADMAGATGADGTTSKTVAVDYPESRDEWQKKHWQAKARELGLATSGNTETVQARVEESEAADEEYKQYNAEDWKADIADAETEDDLADLRAAYDRSGADYSTVASAFDARKTELTEQ